MTPFEQEVRELVNITRRKHGRKPLKHNKKLMRAGRGHAKDMVARGYFAHDSQDGRSFIDRIRKTGYMRLCRRWSVGETLNSGSHSQPDDVVRGWMNSPPHRAVLLSRTFKEIGVGAVTGMPSNPSLGVTVAADFGMRKR